MRYQAALRPDRFTQSIITDHASPHPCASHPVDRFAQQLQQLFKLQPHLVHDLLRDGSLHLALLAFQPRARR